ncbi:elongation factor P-like protein EfpL [Marinobacter gelidimuriae]|uniref:elongation factor P-like protein EfpL n=1 Tax=Marinobacter gelidimuriae TaxID=2739064 RepID=UPI00036734FA|nr:elongation factor P-like protein YeiP [Marinobacter gelidimuriae]
MPRASEIKKNAAIEFEGRVYFVKDIERSVPQGRAGGSLYRMRLYDVVTNSKKDETFKDGDMLNLADLTRRTASFSYADGEEYVFMDTEDYTQYMLNKEAIAEELLFVTEETQGIMVVLIKDAPVALALPPTVDFEIADTAPSVKGGSATARTKPATMVTGLVIQVPEYISTGDRIKVNVEERRFMGRATAE